jgi:hypothetical protein
VYDNDETFTIPLPYEHNICSSFTFTQVTQIEIFAQPTYYCWGIFLILKTISFSYFKYFRIKTINLIISKTVSNQQFHERIEKVSMIF